MTAKELLDDIRRCADTATRQNDKRDDRYRAFVHMLEGNLSAVDKVRGNSATGEALAALRAMTETTTEAVT